MAESGSGAKLAAGFPADGLRGRFAVSVRATIDEPQLDGAGITFT
jgi:hypothetical protein